MSDDEEEDIHQVEAETGEVDGGVGHEEQDGAQLGDLVEWPHEETQAWSIEISSGYKTFYIRNIK